MSNEGAKPLAGVQDEGGALALSRLQFAGLPSQEDKDKALAQAFAEMRKEQHRDVMVPRSPLSQADPGAARQQPRTTNGWQDLVPIAQPPGLSLIDRLVDAALGPAFRPAPKASEPVVSEPKPEPGAGTRRRMGQ